MGIVAGMSARPRKEVQKEYLRQYYDPVLLTGIAGFLIGILVLSGTFDQLTDMIIFAVFIYYGATTLGVFILRKRMPDAPRPYKVWGYPVVPAIVVLFSAALLFNTIYARPREASIGMILMLSGVPIYWLLMKRKRRAEANAKVGELVE